MHLHLLVKDPNKIINEYKRCCNVLDTVIDTIAYKELPENTHDVDDMPQFTNVKTEYDGICEGTNFEQDLIEDVADKATTNLPQVSSLGRKAKKRKMKVGETSKILSETKAKKLLQKRIRPYEPLGYKSQFCINEESRASEEGKFSF